MGIKDNFSQAVKELWKKDGQDQNSAQPSGQPTELEKYLKQGDPAQQGNAPRQPVSDVEIAGGGVPLETPYYRTVPPAAQQAQPEQNVDVQQAPQNSSAAPQQNVQAPRGAAPGQPADGFGQPVREYAQNSEPGFNQNVQNIRQNFGQNNQEYAGDYGQGGYSPNVSGNYNQNGGYGGGYIPPSAGSGAPMQSANETDETTIISKNTVIDGNVRSLANMQIDGNIKGNVETTRNIDMSGKIIGDITCNNAGMNSAAMQGNVSLKGRMRMDRDTILIGDLSSQYADINGRIRGKLDIVGKAELKRDAIVFGDINASTIAVTDGAIIQGYVNTTFLSKEDSRNVFPEAISLDNKEGQSTPKA